MSGYLSWWPKPRQWPTDFDRNVHTTSDRGRYSVVRLAGKRWMAVFYTDDTDPVVLPQRGHSRSAAHRAVRRHVTEQEEVHA